MPKASPFDYFFVLRPLIIIPSWNFLLIGAYLARQERGLYPELGIALLIYTCAMGGIYIINQMVDRETDRINRKLFLIADGYISLKAAWIELVLLWVIAILLSIKFGLVFLLFILLSMLLGIMYSAPPFKLKSRPLLDTFANAFGYGIINCFVGWLVIRQFNFDAILSFLPYFLSIAGVFINTTIVDIEGDKKTNARTTAVFFGTKISYAIAALLMISAVLFAWFNRDYICLIPAVISLPIFLYLAFSSFVSRDISRKLTIISFRLPGFIFTLMTVYLYPLYLIIILIVFVGMRLYYKYRFNMEYPTLNGG